ncbi:mitochondrial 54S ribosomal protein mL54 NDAI_0B04770 [Naumovozyma dairenensis CBS 421]|uniref:Large ribosomal subunit protein mL54 n=1 Tax=Naumovozyma dairenensis (strain ATCC 10597 / BCRC 20456 / CBS 421 / NBRC 0211 / NRRL Y-12639) TaxID=1071378 RepID=G0W6V0_NAUDC|nr:hypothetical protein NDAI_0B04770 [Naumovozyma dairenensis CBS 421]CCD23511.1 hypothetical protein NDAI_0B04770 [Naumovozyma dairenensis CBS 421]
MLRLFVKRSFSTSIKVLNAEVKVASTIASEIKSSCLAGTPLNLNIKKTGKEPIALEDKEYPEWLWTVLDTKTANGRAKSGKGTSVEESLLARKRQLRVETRKKIKQNNFLSQI